MARLGMAILCFCLVLPCVFGAQVRTRQDTGSCDAAFAKAEELRAAEGAAAQGQALDLYKSALSCYGTAPTQQRAKVLSKMARMQLLLSQYKEALESLRRALDNLEQLPNQNTEIQTDEAKVIGNRAYAEKMLARMDQALSDYQESLRRFHDLGNTYYEAFTLEQIGLVYSIVGDAQEALARYDDALKLRASIHPDDIENQQQIAAIFDLEGRVHAQLNDFNDAMMDYRKALSLARVTQYHEFVVLALNDIGALQLKQNRPLIAERYHKRALDYLKLHGSEAKAVAETQALLGDAQTAQGRYDSALQNYHQALDLQEGATDVIGQAQTHFSLGMLEAARKNWPQAHELFGKAVDLFDDSGSLLGDSNARFQNARVLAAQGNVSEARQELHSAVDLGEVIRILAPGPELKTSYFDSVEQMYRAEIDLILKDEGALSELNNLMAFELFQRAQSRTLLDTLGLKMRANLARYGNPETIRNIEEQQQHLGSLLDSPLTSNGKKEILPTVQQIRALAKQLEVESAIREPRLSLFFNVISANDAQQRIIDKDSALIQFYVAEPSSYAWIITQSSIDFVRLPSKGILERNVHLALQFGIGGQWTGSQQVALGRLRKSLAPVFRAARKKRWIVVPDGALHSFPFTVLTSLNGGGRYPEEIVKVPSASAIDMIRRASSNTRPAYELAIFADPVFDDLDSRVITKHSGQLHLNSRSINRSRIRPGESLPRLRYTLKEAQELSRLFPGNQSQSYLQFAATREAASGDALQNFRIVHLATHSLPDERHPELSRVVFSRVTADGSPRPGELFARDIYQMKLSADLVVLSSCQGAMGKQQPGEGPMSLSRAFLFAGSKAVVASLWEVNDEATAELMRSFYRHMIKDKLPPSTALSLAQSEFRQHRDQRLRNPYYWAGFELYGEWVVR